MIDTRMDDCLDEAQAVFEARTKDWAATDEECQRLYLLWQKACERRRRIAILKNNAWGELQMALAMRQGEHR